MSSRPHSSDAGHAGGEELIAIGASTGGTEAIKDILVHLPAGLPGIVIVQHMPETFTGSFAHRLDSLCAFRVKEAEHDEPIRRNTAYIAPGHSHLLVRAAGGAYHVELSREPPVNRHRPSVDVLFGSVARQARHRAIGVILTGMGKDGALGMLEMRRAGAYTIAQDERSSVVYGMPREACSVGGVVDIASLSEIPQRILARLRGDAIARS